MSDHITTGPILVGTDGSETANTAVAEAIRLAAALGQPLHIACAYKPIHGHNTVPGEFTVAPDSQAQAALDDAAARARVGGVEATIHSGTGDAADVLLKLAVDINAALLIVGNKGIGSLKRLVLGNVPSKVVHNSPCSTLVVHTT